MFQDLHGCDSRKELMESLLYLKSLSILFCLEFVGMSVRWNTVASNHNMTERHLTAIAFLSLKSAELNY